MGNGILQTFVLCIVAFALQCQAQMCSFSGTSVKQVIDTNSCSTARLTTLTRQVSREMICDPTIKSKLTSFTSSGGLSFGGGVVPLLPAQAIAPLKRAAQNRGRTMSINSAFRSIVQQVALYTWFNRGRCGYLDVAYPGTSNHESGRAIDVSDGFGWEPFLRAQGFTHLGEADPPHFDFLSAPKNEGKDVVAFQRLWNINCPTDRIPEDGIYGSSTQQRINRAPINGFPVSDSCTVLPGQGDPCNVGGVDGVCQRSHTTCVNGSYKSGACDGPNIIQCCIPNPTQEPTEPVKGGPSGNTTSTIIPGINDGGSVVLLLGAGVAIVSFLGAGVLAVHVRQYGKRPQFVQNNRMLDVMSRRFEPSPFSSNQNMKSHNPRFNARDF